MGHTNATPNYNLPQFIGSDKPAWLTDVNNAMSAIDTAIAAAKAAADNAGGAAAALATTVGGHTTQLETLSTTVTNQGTAIVSQGNAINTISELIGNGTPTTTDHTLIGAINELNAKEGNLSDLTTTDKSSLVAAINEAAAGGGSGQHIEVTADGTKTMAQLLKSLFESADSTKINSGSRIEYESGTQIYTAFASYYTTDGVTYAFNAPQVISSAIRHKSFGYVNNDGVYYEASTGTNGTTTVTDSSTTIPASGAKIRLYY